MHQAATIDVSHENIPTTEPEPILLSKEHYEKLKTLLNQLDTGVEIPTAKTAPCSFFQTGWPEVKVDDGTLSSIISQGPDIGEDD